jgi:ribonucleoside-diphosphate reductase alpha chain
LSAKPLSGFSEIIFRRTYAFDEDETWDGCAARVAKFVANGNEKNERDFYDVISNRKFIPGGRYLYASGREIPQLTNCFLMKAEDSREGWGRLLDRHVNALSTGGGVGTEYSELREKGRPIKRFGGVSSGPLSLMCMVNEVARHVMAGGKRRSALWAGLAWWHPDVEDFIKMKNWSTMMRAMKEADFNAAAPLDMTNISVRLDDAFFRKVKKEESLQQMYYRICKSMCKTGEPGFSVDVGEDKNDILRNPCTEIVSDTDNDCCNLGSINLSNVVDLNDLERVTRIAVRFLYNGTFVSWLPHTDFDDVRKAKRRIGLGLMGLHEWCIRFGQSYEPSGRLGEWLTTWKHVSDEEADKYSIKSNNVRPIAVRAIAPTGTIGIIGETTTGIEPVFCTSYKRRFLDKDGRWKFMYVIDPTVEKLVQELGIEPEDIEDSITLSKDVERRIAMQAFVQDYVDQAISSTINLPEWGEHGNNNAKRFSEILLKYLPKLRGITVYPDGARPGQPIVPVKYDTARGKEDVVFEENEENCPGGVCGL